MDERTCLMWMKEPWPSEGDSLTGRQHAASCTNATTAGHSDWRGPDAAGNNAELNGGTRLNAGWGVVCVRGTSSITGTIASCEGTACDYQ